MWWSPTRRRARRTAPGGVRHSTRSVCPRPAAKRSALRFVLRIVAAPGDRLKVIGVATYINGKRVKEDYAQAADACESCNLPQEATIPKGHLFLMGDNRGFSADSRTWGPVPKRWIIGKVMGETARSSPQRRAPTGGARAVTALRGLRGALPACARR